MVFAGAMIVLGRGTIEPATGLDAVRALGAAGATVLLFRLIPPVVPWVGIPLCVAAFTAATLALGLMGPRDLTVLRTLVRRRRVDEWPACENDR